MNLHQQQRFDAAHSMDRAQTLLRLRGFYERVRSLALAPQPDLERIAEVIQEEVAFKELVLRVVNSTRTGLFHPIQSVKHAVSLLGAARVFTLADTELDRISGPCQRTDDVYAAGKPEHKTPSMHGPSQPRRSRSA